MHGVFGELYKLAALVIPFITEQMLRTWFHYEPFPSSDGKKFFN